MMKVAIIIPTMDRPDFILRQFEFYEQMKSPHPVYISDSSNEENAEKIKNGIKKFKNFEIAYQWAPPGKDCLYQLTPLVKEKYCIQMGDDALIIPKTISECANFLESNPGYGTCMGKQINIRLENDVGLFGKILRISPPINRSAEHDDLRIRVKDLFQEPIFIVFSVRKTDDERAMRDITRHFFLASHMEEFLVVNLLLSFGKSKTLDKLGYIMQIHKQRHAPLFYNSYIDFLLSPDMHEQWKTCEREFAGLLHRQGMSMEESLRTVKWLFTFFLSRQFTLNTQDVVLNDLKHKINFKKKLKSKLKHFARKIHMLKKIYQKINPPVYADNIQSKYYQDFKIVKDFIEKN